MLNKAALNNLEISAALFQKQNVMKLKSCSRKEIYAAIQAIRLPGQDAFLIGNDIIRICNRQSLYVSFAVEIRNPEQLELKEYKIIA